MAKRFSSFLPLFGVSILLFLLGCPTTTLSGNPVNTGNAGNSDNTTNKITGKINLLLNALNYNQAARTTQAISATNTNNKMAESILSGPPEQMIIYLKSIKGLSATESAPVSFWTSTLPGGSPISLKSGSLDLSGQDLSQLSAPVGSYNGIVLEFARVAKIKGSIQGTFRFTRDAVAGSYAHLVGITNQYTSEASTQGETRTFYTRADKSQLSVETFSTDIIGHNADFDGASTNITDPELTDVDLNTVNDENLTVAQIRQGTAEITSNVNFTVDQNTPLTLTLEVDLNRMLRFYSNTRADHQPPAPNMKGGTSYFFISPFRESVSVFVGEIGSVEGYQLFSDVYGGWMTIFRDASGSVISVAGSPDDGNNMAIVKGRGANLTGDLTTGLGAYFDESKSTISGFKGTELGATASATISYAFTWLNPSTYTLTYQRML